MAVKRIKIGSVVQPFPQDKYENFWKILTLMIRLPWFGTSTILKYRYRNNSNILFKICLSKSYWEWDQSYVTFFSISCVICVKGSDPDSCFRNRSFLKCRIRIEALINPTPHHILLHGQLKLRPTGKQCGVAYQAWQSVVTSPTPTSSKSHRRYVRVKSSRTLCKWSGGKVRLFWVYFLLRHIWKVHDIGTGTKKLDCVPRKSVCFRVHSDLTILVI